MDATSVLLVDLPEVMKAPERITQRLNSAGITGMLDAAVAPELFADVRWAGEKRQAHGTHDACAVV